MGSKQTRQQEWEDAKMINGRRHIFSGAGDEKWDFSSDKYLGDSKQTEGKSISVNRKNLEELSKRAILQGQTPVMTLLFLEMSRLYSREWCLIPKEHFERLIKEDK